MSLSTPVIFLIFRRPDLTAQVFEQIRLARPSKLFVVADGPRNDEEAALCEQARAVTEAIDWDCEVFRNYADVNLGCRKRISSGIDWAFDHVEEAIILEDDCLPAPSFFQYCQTLLNYYRDDQRVMHIGGSNYFNSNIGPLKEVIPYLNAHSYIFSKYVFVWGWATWKRSWKCYDLAIGSWPQFRDQNLLRFLCPDPFERDYWSGRFEIVYSEAYDTWDYSWVYTCWSQGGLSIVPSVNLVSNIGFGEFSTHTTQDSPVANLDTGNIEDLVHPQFVIGNIDIDSYIFNYLYEGARVKRDALFLNRLKQKFLMELKRIFKTL